MSDEQHPEIVDIGLTALPPLRTSTLEEISSGLLVNIHDTAARSMAREILDLRKLRERVGNLFSDMRP